MKLRSSKKPRVNFRRTYRKSNIRSVRRNITHSGKWSGNGGSGSISHTGGGAFLNQFGNQVLNRFANPLNRSVRDQSRNELTTQNIGRGEVNETFLGKISKSVSNTISKVSQSVISTYNPVFILFREFSDNLRAYVNHRDVAMLGLISGEYIKAGWIPVSDGTEQFAPSYTTTSAFSTYSTETQVNALKSLFDRDANVPTDRKVSFNLLSCIIDSRFTFEPIYKPKSDYKDGILLGYIVYNTINKADTINNQNTRARIIQSLRHGEIMVTECKAKFNAKHTYDINLLTNRIFGFRGTKPDANLSQEGAVMAELTETDLYYNDGIFPILRTSNQPTSAIIYIKYTDSLKNPVAGLATRNKIRAYEESVISYMKLFDIFGASSYEIKNDVMTASLDTLVKVLSNSVEPTNRLSAEPLLTIAGKSVLCSHFAFFILGRCCTDYIQLSNPATVEVYKKSAIEYIAGLRARQFNGGGSPLPNPLQSLLINQPGQLQPRPEQIAMTSNPMYNSGSNAVTASPIFTEFFNKAVVLLNRISVSVNTLTRSTTSAFRLSLISIILLHMMDPITKKHVDLDKRYSTMPIDNAIRCKIEVINAITNMLDKFVVK